MNKEQQPQMNVDFSKTETISCEKCENDTFIQVYKMRKLSALLSPTGKETMIPIQVFACANCNHIDSIFLPKDD